VEITSTCKYFLISKKSFFALGMIPTSTSQVLHMSMYVQLCKVTSNYVKLRMTTSN